VIADIAEAGGAQERIGDGVQHDVGVGMAGEPARMVDTHAAQNERPARDEPMRIVASADADHSSSRYLCRQKPPPPA
jgi:hypothetical protein